MSDAWVEIQAIKSKRNSLRERLEKRKKERQEILGTSSSGVLVPEASHSSVGASGGPSSPIVVKNSLLEARDLDDDDLDIIECNKPDAEIEKALLRALCEVTLTLPTSSREISSSLSKNLAKHVSHQIVCNLLQKFAAQLLIAVKEDFKDGKTQLELISAEHSKLLAMVNDLYADESTDNGHVEIVETKTNLSSDSTSTIANNTVTNNETNLKRKHEDLISTDVENSKVAKMDEEKKKDSSKKDTKATADILSLLSMPSTKEKQHKKVGEEILDLLSKPTAKEKSLAERFRSQGGAQVMEFCPHGTKAECVRANGQRECKKLHFKKIIQKHTDEQLGDCSFLNTCFHMDTCKYVHYEVDGQIQNKDVANKIEKVETKVVVPSRLQESTVMYPPQWVQCDLRYLDMNALGKFAVIMADPPWDIHMELPYGTMSDDEMRQLGIPQLQDEGLIFLWVTGRAMELGRECLKLWGYERVDEIIWVKTNQLQRIIRTGRTGHWLNHGKEHCLVGMKGNPDNLNRGLDCDVIVAEVRATSHKPDEIYGMIERLSPGTRKIELFGRPHNVQPNWITLGNQVDGIRLVDPELFASFKKRYPDGNCMGPPTETQ